MFYDLGEKVPKMVEFVDLVEIHRGTFLECVHQGSAVIADNQGKILAQWGDCEQIILPRSSCKMVQALPLVESGAAKKFGLKSEHLALSCASHQGSDMHIKAVDSWLKGIGLSEENLRCGVQPSADKEQKEYLIRQNKKPDQRHNNCSGKHSGFLTLNKYLSAGSEYIEIDHPVQNAIKNATEELCGETLAGFGIDGCSAPNFAMSLLGLATAMARMGNPSKCMGTVRRKAANSLVAAMAQHPDLVAGKGRACTELMKNITAGTVVKTGADGVFIAIIPSKGLGVAVKIRDGATRASEAVITALLVRLGVADPKNPMIKKRLCPNQVNWRGIKVGYVCPTKDLYQNGAQL